jgi:hypothetical protein
MFRFICLCIFFCGVTSLWSQVEPSATGGNSNPDEDLRMSTPPPVSGQPYPTTVGSEMRSNFVSAGVVFTAAYADNLVGVQSASKISDETYSILPTISLQKKTPRQNTALNYGAGFSFFQHTSELNAITQDASVDYQYRPTRYTTIDVGDYFTQNSNSYNQANPGSGSGISATSPSQSTVLLVPFVNQSSNLLNGTISHQFSRNAMIGGGGSYNFLHYGQSAGSSGVYDANSGGASAFYGRRFLRNQYFGINYAFSTTTTNPNGTAIDTNTAKTDTHAILGFYTLYLKHAASVSVSAGPQYFMASQPPHPATSGWTPAVTVSGGWQEKHVNVAGTYSRTVFSGGGLHGTYHSNAASASIQYRVTRTWDANILGSYSNYESATPIYSAANEGGRTMLGSVGIQHRIANQLHVEFGYGHFYQGYAGSQTAASFPDGNRAYVSINYQITRPIGR